MTYCGRFLARGFSLLWEEEEKGQEEECLPVADCYPGSFLVPSPPSFLGGGEGAGGRMTTCGRLLAREFLCCRRRKRR